MAFFSRLINNLRLWCFMIQDIYQVVLVVLQVEQPHHRLSNSNYLSMVPIHLKIALGVGNLFHGFIYDICCYIMSEIDTFFFIFLFPKMKLVVQFSFNVGSKQVKIEKYPQETAWLSGLLRSLMCRRVSFTSQNRMRIRISTFVIFSQFDNHYVKYR